MIAVLGPTGFVGGHLLAQLRSGREPVRCVVRDRRHERRLRALGFGVAVADLRDRSALSRALAGARAVVNLVTITRETQPDEFREVHYEGMRSLVAAARIAGAGRVVHVGALGTDAFGGDPRHQYLYWKGRARDVLRDSGLDWTILETSIVFGPGDQLLTVVALGLRWLPVFPIVHGGAADTRFQPIWVGDLVRCLRRSLDDETTSGQTFPLGGPQVWDYRTLVRFVDRLLGTGRRLVTVPAWLARSVLATGGAYMRYVPVTTAMLDLMVSGVDSVADSTATHRRFGIEPLDLPAACGYLTRVGPREWLHWQRRAPAHGAFAARSPQVTQPQRRRDGCDSDGPWSWRRR